MISKDNEWHVYNRNCYDHSEGYVPESANKTLTRMQDFDGHQHNVGTQLLVKETVVKDYPYSLTIFFRSVPFPIKPIVLPIECNKGDIRSACSIADDMYRSYCTEMVKYFTKDCKMLPEI